MQQIMNIEKTSYMGNKKLAYIIKFCIWSQQSSGSKVSAWEPHSGWSGQDTDIAALDKHNSASR